MPKAAQTPSTQLPCPRCGKEREPPSGKWRRAYCKACFAIYARERNMANPDRSKVAGRAWRQRNPDKVAAANKKTYAADPEYYRGKAREWRLANPEKVKIARAAWREANPERYVAAQAAWFAAHREERKLYRKQQHQNTRERANALARLWKKSNASRVTALNCKRQALRLKAIPVWANLEKIEAMYRAARDITVETGIVHHVDHIVPLQSKWVCGLHCEANLEVIVGTDNQRKSNRRWPDMPAHLSGA